MTPIQTHPDAPWLGGWVALGPATFSMGAAEDDRFATRAELPRREIHLGRFAIGVFPVTEAAWEFEEGGGLPVVGVSWDDADRWLLCAGRKCGLPLRLPSEAEWEFAARAGNTGGFPGPTAPSAAEANFLHDETKERVGPGTRTPAGTYPPNAFGIEDMLGNVAEWVSDHWSPDLSSVPENGGAFVASGEARVVRSAGWDALPRLLRLSARHPLDRHRRQDNLGFRIAFDLP